MLRANVKPAQFHPSRSGIHVHSINLTLSGAVCPCFVAQRLANTEQLIKTVCVQ